MKVTYLTLTMLFPCYYSLESCWGLMQRARPKDLPINDNCNSALIKSGCTAHPSKHGKTLFSYANCH